MNVCILGNGLISLVLAKALINKKIKVSMYFEKDKKYTKDRTIGISPNNFDFIQKEVIKIKKNLIWKINQIKIYDNKNIRKNILDFKKKNNNLFYIIKNHTLKKILLNNLNKSNYFKKIKIKNKSIYSKIIEDKKFELIFNCDTTNYITKKFFFKNISKSYKSEAYVTIINHDKINNNGACQVFTKYGPLAFLPISSTQTSIVFSIKDNSFDKEKKLRQIDFEKLIIKNNNFYKINSINVYKKFILNQKILRKYYHDNILSFGDVLHQIHPLAGQGFNMSLRDMKSLLNLINKNFSLGLPLDQSLLREFENKTKHMNFLFASGNDFIYEFFNYDNTYLKLLPKQFFNYLNNNKIFNKLVNKFADKGLSL